MICTELAGWVGAGIVIATGALLTWMLLGERFLAQRALILDERMVLQIEDACWRLGITAEQTEKLVEFSYEQQGHGLGRPRVRINAGAPQLREQDHIELRWKSGLKVSAWPKVGQ